MIDPGRVRAKIALLQGYRARLARLVVASEGWQPATDFRDSFTRLEQHGVIDPDLASRMRALAGQRNLLVHLYGEVDDALVHAFLQGGLDDLDRFASALAALLGDAPSGGTPR